MTTPDNNSSGFLNDAPKAERYENTSTDPDDVAVKISSLISSNVKVLDVGCGTGSVSEVIQKITNAKLMGIEPDAVRAAAANARGLKVLQGFLTEKVLQEHGPFDAIIFADVLEHLPNPAEMVLIAKKGLLPGGSIIASVPNIAHWFVRTDLLRGRFDYQDCGIMDATHLRWFTRKTFIEFFERCGFQITSLSCTVNVQLPDYQRRLPWRWLSQARRRKIVGALVKRFPGLFGCQFIIRATLPAQK